MADKIMTETGTILLERKTVARQIDEILKLDETDPIRKLQLYFKDGNYGNEYDADGVRIPKKHKAPKSNFVMQRYEDKLKRQQARKA